MQCLQHVEKQLKLLLVVVAQPVREAGWLAIKLS
jgi:hypothetical protein